MQFSFLFHLKKTFWLVCFDNISYSSIIYSNSSGWFLGFQKISGHKILYSNHQETTYGLFPQDPKKRQKDKTNQNQRNVGLIPNEKPWPFKAITNYQNQSTKKEKLSCVAIFVLYVVYFGRVTRLAVKYNFIINTLSL